MKRVEDARKAERRSILKMQARPPPLEQLHKLPCVPVGKGFQNFL